VTQEVRALARIVFDYLYCRDAHPDEADLIVGFGHFDPKIPARCCELYRQSYGPRILFTGGVGAGTADLGQPEALFFRDEIRRQCPSIPQRAVVLEAASTHTGENVRFSLWRLREVDLAYDWDSGLRRVILVATAYRQRRVWLTWQRHAPRISAINAPPRTTLEAERALFAEKGQDLVALMVGEVDRILRYGPLGYITEVEVPEAIVGACARLRELGYGPEGSGA
jgi:hypothetical protein